MWKTWIQSMSWEDSLEKEMATHSILAWEIPWTEEPGRLQSIGSQRVRHNWATEQRQKQTHWNVSAVVQGLSGSKWSKKQKLHHSKGRIATAWRWSLNKWRRNEKSEWLQGFWIGSPSSLGCLAPERLWGLERVFPTRSFSNFNPHFQDLPLCPAL